MKKIAKTVLALALVSVMALNVSAAATFSKNRDIAVVSRESGSGTRGAFIELFGVLEKDANGEHDRTTKEAVIANTTELVFTNVSGDPHAIGYVSLGSLNSAVKAVQIDGVNATIDNVKNKTYKVSRPFIITTKKTVSAITRDFYDFIFSKEGQAVLAGGYIPVLENAPAYASKGFSGRVVVAGSSSVTPIMEKVAEAYEKLNPKANIEIQMSDSGAGVKATIDGVCDIGMASRELKPEERETIYNYRIAIDGIAVVVNKQNPLAGLTSAQVKDIFTGKALSWSDIK
jgi:phosphate transport system substrate-binding protein